MTIQILEPDPSRKGAYPGQEFIAVKRLHFILIGVWRRLGDHTVSAKSAVELTIKGVKNKTVVTASCIPLQIFVSTRSGRLIQTASVLSREKKTVLPFFSFCSRPSFA